MTSPHAFSVRGERKLAVSLFADLSGYTALCRRLDPEDVAQTVTPLMRSLRDAVEVEGGVVVTVAGDGFFALFGVPIGHADSPFRALRAAQAMGELVESRNAQPGLQRVPDVHVGIAAGEVLVTSSDDSLGWSVVGSSVNLASRLCDVAGAGEILIDDAARQLLNDVSWSGTRSIQLKGLDHEVVAWLPRPALDRRAVRPSPQIFTARAREIAVLDECLTDVVTNARSRVVYVTGEAGIGKTHLLARWMDLHRELRSSWLWCGNTVHGGALSALLDRLSDGDTVDASVLVGTTRGAFGDLDFAAHGEDRFPLLLARTRQLLEGNGNDGPFAVVIDDLSPTDPSMTQVLADIEARPIDGQLLILCTARRDQGVDQTERIHLERLATDELATLLEAAMGGRPPPEVIEAIAKRAGGHPLMAVQSAIFLVERGIVEVVDGKCNVTLSQALGNLPSSLRLFVEARLDGLPAAEKALIQELSTFGDSFGESWVRTVLGGDPRPLIDDLTNRRLLHEDGGGWRFTHTAVQEVAYSTLTRQARTGLHRRQLELLPADAATELRAYHAMARFDTSSAGDPHDTADAAAAAMAETLRLARQLYRSQALGCHASLDRVRGLVRDYAHLAPEVATQTLILDAQCLIELGRFDEALHAATTAEELSARFGVSTHGRAQVLLVRGSALSRLRRYESARQKLDEAAAIADQLDDDSLRAQALYLTAQTWRVTLFGRFVSLTEAAYDLYLAAGDDVGAGECARMLAYLQSVGPAERFDRWCAIARTTTHADDLRGLAWIARATAMAMAARYDFSEAVGCARQAVDLGERIGAVDIVADGLIDEIESLLMLGRVPEAAAGANRLIEFAGQHGNPRMQAAAAAHSAVAMLRVGDRARCLEELEFARSAIADLGVSEDYNVSSASAVVRRDCGDWQEALAGFEHAEATGNEAGFVLMSLANRLERLRIVVQTGTRVDPSVFEALSADCQAAGAPKLRSFVRATADQARLVIDADPAPSVADDGICVEEEAMRADTAALRAELLAVDAAPLWTGSRELWQRQGYTVWLARAQARCGDVGAATATLDVLGSPATAREWALGGAAG